MWMTLLLNLNSIMCMAADTHSLMDLTELPTSCWLARKLLSSATEMWVKAALPPWELRTLWSMWLNATPFALCKPVWKVSESWPRNRSLEKSISLSLPLVIRIFSWLLTWKRWRTTPLSAILDISIMKSIWPDLPKFPGSRNRSSRIWSLDGNSRAEREFLSWPKEDSWTWVVLLVTLLSWWATLSPIKL